MFYGIDIIRKELKAIMEVNSGHELVFLYSNELYKKSTKL